MCLETNILYNVGTRSNILFKKTELTRAVKTSNATVYPMNPRYLHIRTRCYSKYSREKNLLKSPS